MIRIFNSNESEKMSHLIDESKEAIVAKFCKEVLVAKEIWEWCFP